MPHRAIYETAFWYLLPLDPLHHSGHTYLRAANLMSSPMHDRRRSQRVLLRIPIAVIASGPDKKMAREQTHTLVVNAHGALINLELPVRVGQVIILQNPETCEEQSCRVIRVNAVPGGKPEVGIEFLKPAPHFWRVAFPPDDWVPHSPEITSDTF